MAAARPAPMDIENLISFTGNTVSAAQAELLLQKYNTPDNALNEYFNDPGKALQAVPAQPPVATWGEMDNVPGFRIEGEDTVDSSVHGAVSRPNSRVSNARDHAHDLTTQHPASADQEEEQIRRAMALSVGQDIPAQETGVTGTGQQFGVASDAHYEPNKWALTTTRATIKEVVEQPPASRRRRSEDHPVFLRGSDKTGYLGPLLTIYHSIPLAREALLMPSFKVLSYGHDPTWWSGSSDENTKAVSVETSGEITSDISNVICEIQSLMAFLDGTYRAYGSVDGLADLHGFRMFPAETAFSRLLEVWKASAMAHNPEDQLSQIFTSVALKNAYPGSDMPATKIFSCLEPPVADHEGISLYDLLDNAVWNDNVDVQLDDVWIEHCAEVFTMRLYRLARDGQGVGIRVPAEWYPDRYLDECRAQSWEMRTKKQKVAQRIRQIEAKKHFITHMPTKGRQGTIDIRITLAAAAEAARTAAQNKPMPNGIHGDMEPLLADDTGITKGQADECEADLRNLIDRINRKLAVLDERKKEAENMYFELTRQMTKDARNGPVDGSGGPTHKYMLQGVSTKPHITYVRLPPKRDLVDLDDHDERQDHEKANEADWVWWRISFSRDDATVHPRANDNHAPVAGPATQSEAMNMNGHISDWSRKVQLAQNHTSDTYGYNVVRVREVEVLKAARDESDSVVLVYANENALSFRGSEPSDALKAFVAADNRAFERELERESFMKMKENGSEIEERGDPFADVPMNDHDAALSMSMSMGMGIGMGMGMKTGLTSPPLTPPLAAESDSPAHLSSDSSLDAVLPPPYSLQLQPHTTTTAATAEPKPQEMVENTHGSIFSSSSHGQGSEMKGKGGKIGMYAEKMLERVDQHETETGTHLDKDDDHEHEHEQEHAHANAEAETEQ